MESIIDILLVDDEPRNLDALEAILADPGYRLLRATTPNDALRALLDHDVAAIVMDIHMPELNGVELAKLIKGTKKFREIPILFFTALLMEDQSIIEGYGAGAVDYLTKPVNPEILRRKIAVFAELFRKTRALAELNETLESRVQERTAKLEESEAALRLAAQQKDEFLATLAHELRNPLAPLRMGLDLLMSGGSTADTLTIMNRQLDHMVRLIDDLLDVARITGGKLELKKQRTNLAEAVRVAIETCRPFFQKRRQTVTAELDSSLFAFADPTRVAQIIGNLLHNACKFSPDDSQIKVSVTLAGAQAKISVADAGVGIAHEQLPRLFDMFSHVAPPAKGVMTGGLGIGLALSRKLAEMHGGALTVESAGLGQGSIFTFTIPAQAGEVELTPVSRRPTPSSRTPAAINVVVIEDNQDSAEMLELSLQLRGFVTSVAHTGPEGLELVQERRPHVILCDIGLPEMSGTEVCKHVRNLDPNYRPVMIALTGWGMKEDVRRTLEAGFDHHLVKPVEPEKLFQLLDHMAPSVLAAG